MAAATEHPFTPSPSTRPRWLLWLGITLFVSGGVAGALALPLLNGRAFADPEEKAKGARKGSEQPPRPPAPGAAPAGEEADPDIGLAMHLEQAFIKVAKRVAPSVVSLTVQTQGKDWNEQLWQMHEKLGPLSQEREFTGSGVIIREDGTIVTNQHVINDAVRIVVTLHDGTSFRGQVVGEDPRSDLAVVRPLPTAKIPAKFQPTVLADSDLVSVGQMALAIGNPFKLSNTVTVGFVSFKGRSLTAQRFSFSDVFYGDMIQTDAAINPGNSGGPLFNIRGELIGINTMIYSKSGSFEGFGFAIPTNQVKPRLALLEKGRAMEYGWLGVRLKNLDPDQEAFLLPKHGGVLVEEVLPDMPADRAGLKRGSVITTFEGQPVGNSDQLIMAVGLTQPGKLTTVQLINPEGQVVEMKIRVGRRSTDLVRLSREVPRKAAEEDLAERPGEWTWRGLRIRELPAQEAKQAGGRLRIVYIKKGSAADRAGLYEGAVIDELKSSESASITILESLDQLRVAAGKSRGAVYIHICDIGYVQLDSDGGL